MNQTHRLYKIQIFLQKLFKQLNLTHKEAIVLLKKFRLHTPYFISHFWQKFKYYFLITGGLACIIYGSVLWINFSIHSNLERLNIEQILQNELKEKLNINFTMQGKDYRFTEGIILHEVSLSLSDEKSKQNDAFPYQLKASRIVIKVPLLAFYQQKFILNEQNMVIENAKILIPNMSLPYLNHASQLLKKISEYKSNFIFKDIELEFSDKEPSLSLSPYKFKMDLSFIKKQTLNFSNYTQMNVQLSSPQSSFQLNLATKWISEDEQQFIFDFEKFPIESLTIIQKNLNKFFPSFLSSDLEKNITKIVTNKGTLSGKLLVDYNLSTEQKRLHLDCNYQDIEAKIWATTFPQLSISKANGHLSLIQQIQKKENILTQNMNLRIKQKGLEMHWQHSSPLKDQKLAKNKDIKSSNLTFKVQLSKKSGYLHLMKQEIEGIFEGKLKLTKVPKSSYSIVAGNLSINNLKMYIKDTFKSLHSPAFTLLRNQNYFQINSMEIDIIPEIKNLASNIQLYSTGYFLDIPFHLQTGGTLRFNNKASPFRLETTLSANLGINNLDLNSLFYNIKQSHSQILLKGIDKMKNNFWEDGNPWQYDFNSSPIYTCYLGGLQLNLNVNVKNLQKAKPLPSNLSFKGNIKQGTIRLYMDKVSTDDYALSFDYSGQFNKALPYHNFNTHFMVKNGETDIKFLTNNQTPIGQLKLNYNYTSKGWMLSDLLKKSHSKLTMDLKSFQTTNKTLIYAISKAIAVIEKQDEKTYEKLENLYFDNFSFKRTSHKLKTSFLTTGNLQELNVSGAGLYVFGVGGKIQYHLKPFKLENKDAKKNKNRVSIQILPNGKWVL